MDKNTFLNSFNQCEKNYISSLYDDMLLCEKINTVVFSKEFLIPYIYNKLIQLESALNVKILTYGVYEDCERKMVAFYTEDKPETFPIDLLKITNKSKFKSLAHKDYLGSIMALGIKREMYGDFIVEDDHCYVPVVSEVTSYIMNNLTHLGNCPCKIDILDQDICNVPKLKFDTRTIIITSLRLDNVIPGICNITRGNGNTLISNGSVMINHIECMKKDKLIKPNDIVTIRGYGKYKVSDIVGETQKNRLKIAIKKYI